MLYLPLPRDFQPDSIDRALIRDWRDAAQAVVLRVHPGDEFKLARGTYLRQQLSHRFEGQPILLLRWEPRSYRGAGRYLVSTLVARRGIPVSGLVKRELRNACRSAELQTLVRRARGVVRLRPTFTTLGLTDATTTRSCAGEQRFGSR